VVPNTSDKLREKSELRLQRNIDTRINEQTRVKTKLIRIKAHDRNLTSGLVVHCRV